MRGNVVLFVIAAICCALTMFSDQIVEAASKIRVVGSVGGGSVVVGSRGAVLAQSNARIASIKDGRRMSQDCGSPMYSVSFDCGRSVAVKGPDCGSLREVRESDCGSRKTLVFDNGDHIHVKNTRKGVVIDHDD